MAFLHPPSSSDRCLGPAVGNVANSLFPTLTGPVGGYGVAGMAAVFAAAARAPFSAIVIVFEMTGDYAIIMPLMTAVVIATVVARSFSRETIYTTKLMRRGIDIRREEVSDVMRMITVGEAMTRDFPTVQSTAPASTLLGLFQKTRHHGFPVLDAEGNLFSVVTLKDLEESMEMEANNLTIGDIAVKSPFVAYPDQSLQEVLGAEEEDYGRIPVVTRSDERRLVGVLRRYDIITAYRKRARELARRSLRIARNVKATS